MPPPHLFVRRQFATWLRGGKVRFAVGDVFEKDTVAVVIAEFQPDIVNAVLQSCCEQELAAT
ncbi:MAG: hypothetical protein P8L66_11205 [Rhodospirillaceae bacterium]|nr:hypothetical protein [Rhodospirillaceae bacterium]